MRVLKYLEFLNDTSEANNVEGISFHIFKITRIILTKDKKYYKCVQEE